MILYRVQKSKHCTRILRTKSWSYSPVLKKLTKKRNNARLSYSDRLRSSAKWKDRRRSRRCLMTRKRRLKRPRHKKLKKRLLKPLLRLQQKLKRLLKRKRPKRKRMKRKSLKSPKKRSKMKSKRLPKLMRRIRISFKSSPSQAILWRRALQSRDQPGLLLPPALARMDKLRK